MTVTEQGLSIQIKKELNLLKAPSELVARTKESVAKEGAQERVRRKKIIRYSAGGAVLAAAAAFFLLVSVPKAVQPNGETQSGTWLRLGALTDGREIYVEEEVAMERVKILPMAFRQAEGEDVIDGVRVWYVQSGDGCWMAAFEDQGAFVVITAQVTDKQEVTAIMEKLLAAE